ncbi:NifB/NifX family molybdenum-iron cluster-binding protein [Candidatus Woesearchaeota archaeon]|nr:NifB/NifX family molybdenum-iron cluster-binding protein [Candidatus Woesearchaeota archaeon]
MRIAITCQEDTLDSMIDQRFGRCRYFLIVDIEKGEITRTEAVLNQGAEQGHGAAIKAGEQMGDLKVEKVLTGQLGPNATTVLGSLGITAYHASGTAKEAIKQLINDELETISETAKPHPDTKKTSDQERILFPLLDNKGMDSEISQHFGHAPFVGLYDAEKKELDIIENDLDHTDPSKSPIDQIEEKFNPTAIFAKDIGGRAVSIIKEKGLALKTGDYKTVKEAIANIDRLEDQKKDCGQKH